MLLFRHKLIQMMVSCLRVVDLDLQELRSAIRDFCHKASRYFEISREEREECCLADLALNGGLSEGRVLDWIIHPNSASTECSCREKV